MKKVQTVALLITILFCIDFSITELLGFHMIFTRIQDMDTMRKIFAFVIGICGFIDILLFKKEDE